MATNEPTVVGEDVGEELELEAVDTMEESTEVEESVSDPVVIVDVPIPDDILTNDIYMQGVTELVNKIDSESVNDEVYYVDRGSFFALGDLELPDYAVVYQCQGVDVVFPTDYAENIIIADGLLINLGSNYTAGAQIDGYDVSNYLSSEITIPTYHSSTWYQYLQTYGQPYRIVDRYVNNNGYISSSTRSSVAVEWSGGNPWEGFNFSKASMFIVICILAFMLVFRKGK